MLCHMGGQGQCPLCSKSDPSSDVTSVIYKEAVFKNTYVRPVQSVQSVCMLKYSQIQLFLLKCTKIFNYSRTQYCCE